MGRFSLKRLFASTALIALGVALYGIPGATGCYVARKGGPPLSEPVQWLFACGGAAVFGTGIGNIFHRPLIGAAVGIALLLVIILLTIGH